MQRAGAAYLLQLAAQAAHPLTDHPPIGLDLRLAGAAEKAEATALALKVGPAAHQPALLVVEMREFDLQAAFRRCRPFAEDFEDQPGPVNDLALELLLQIALLDCGQGAIDDNQLGLVQLAISGDPLDLTRTEQRGGLGNTDRQDIGLRDDKANRERQPLRLFHPAFRREVGALPGDLRTDHQCTRAARNLIVKFVVDYQLISSWTASVPHTLNRRRSRR